MDLASVKSQIIVETNKFRLGPCLLKLQTLTTGSATKISKIKGVNGAIVPSLGSAPISLLNIDTVIAFPLTLKLPILFSSEVFEDNDLGYIMQKSFRESFHFADIENQIVIETLIKGAGKIITGETHPNVKETPLIKSIHEGMKFLEDNKYAPNKLIINPDIAESLRQREELKEKLQSYAMDVIINTSVPKGTIIILDKNHAGLFLERVAVNIKDHADPMKDKKGFLLRERVVPVVTDGNAVVVIQ
jgi:hypothetical protein